MPDQVLEKKKVGFFIGAMGVVPRPGRRCDRGVPARRRPSLRGVLDPERSSGSFAASRRTKRARPAARVDPDARGVAARLPAAGDGRRLAGARADPGARLMCGICGVVQVGGEARAVLAPGVLDRMTDVLSHRGPDDRGTYEAAGVALGARRLSIVDVAGGHQPVRNEQGTVWAARTGAVQPSRAAPAAGRGRASVREPLRHRDPAAPVRARG